MEDAHDYRLYVIGTIVRGHLRDRLQRLCDEYLDYDAPWDDNTSEELQVIEEQLTNLKQATLDFIHTLLLTPIQHDQYFRSVLREA